MSHSILCRGTLLAVVLAIPSLGVHSHCYGQTAKPKKGLSDYWHQLTDKLPTVSGRRAGNAPNKVKPGDHRAAAIREPKIDSRQSGIDIMLATAINHENRGDHAQAIQTYEEILHQERNAIACHRLGRLLYTQGNAEQAWDYLEEAVKLDPKNVELKADVCYLLYSSEAYAEAENWARNALKLAPRNQRLNNNLGLVLVAQGRHEEAYQAFVNGGNSKADALSNVGQAALLLDQHAVAERYLSRAAETSSGETKLQAERSLETLANLPVSPTNLPPIVSASATSSRNSDSNKAKSR